MIKAKQSVFFFLIQFNWTIDFSISFSLSFCSRSRGLHLLGIVHIVPFSLWFDLPPLCLLFVPLPSFSKRLLCLGNFFFFSNLQNYIWALILPWNWLGGHLIFLMSIYHELWVGRTLMRFYPWGDWYSKNKSLRWGFHGWCSWNSYRKGCRIFCSLRILGRNAYLVWSNIVFF